MEEGLGLSLELGIIHELWICILPYFLPTYKIQLFISPCLCTFLVMTVKFVCV